LGWIAISRGPSTEGGIQGLWLLRFTSFLFSRHFPLYIDLGFTIRIELNLLPRVTSFFLEAVMVKMMEKERDKDMNGQLAASPDFE